jgi:hypothetical protein
VSGLYCIYSGHEVEETSMNIEHIIPLSLGGCDSFSIYVEKNINSHLGTEVDGKLSQDFLIGLDRVQAGSKGHSGKIPNYDVKKSRIDGHPVITTFTKEGVMVFDPVGKRQLQGKGSIEIQMKLDIDIRFRFTAKVALATGFFLFGETFANYANCLSLRKIMLSKNLRETYNEDPSIFTDIRGFDPLRTIQNNNDPNLEIYKHFCKYCNCSNVFLTYSPQSIIVHTGINGTFVGCINFPADVSKFPNDKDFWLGHVLLCKNGVLVRKSWRSALMEMSEANHLLTEEQLRATKEFEQQQNGLYGLRPDS